MRRCLLAAVVVLAVVTAGCVPDRAGAGESGGPATSVATTVAPATSLPIAAAPTTAPTPTMATTPATTVAISLAPPPTTHNPYARPDWLGTRILPRGPDGRVEVPPTPPELQDRRLETLELLPPPSGDEFGWSIGSVPADVLARSTWTEECPVGVDELAYLTMSHWGFDEKLHTGEMIVNAAWADDIVAVFRKLHAARFPIEQMRVIRLEEIDAPPTGDGNDTTSFVCRPAVGSGNWSRHAYGLAIDINPFNNPYFNGDLVIPELASAYRDRDLARPGVIVAGDVVVEAFAAIGWPWGGNWSSLKDYMHFSSDGR